jgi:4-amino-4-deoxy-L-arabinose transferase-like glycosyltransferase
MRLQSPSLTLDDAVEAVHAQSWALGANALQPPLYTWLLTASTSVLGPGVPAHLAVRFPLLLAALLATYAAARATLGPGLLAGLAAASLTSSYLVGFYVQQGLTQTVAVLAAVALSYLLLLRILEGRARLPGFAALGATIAAGVLSKYNFVVYLAALIGAAALGPERHRLADRRFLVTLAVALVLTAPYAAWLAAVADPRAEWLAAMEIGSDGFWSRRLRTLGAIGEALPTLLLPMAALWAVLLPEGARAPAAATGARRLVGTWLVLSAVLIVAGPLIAGLGNIRPRYLAPLLVPLALWFFLRLSRASPERLARFAAAVLIAWAGLAVGLGLYRIVGAVGCSSCWSERDYGPAAAAMRAAGFAGGNIVTAGAVDAANLLTYFPGSAVYTAQFPRVVPPRRAAPCLVAQEIAAGGDIVLDPRLARLLAERFAIDVGALPAMRRAQVPLLGLAGGARWLGYAIVPAERCVLRTA